MGKQESVKKIDVNDPHLKTVSSFIEKILKLKQPDRILYIDSISKKEIDIISEIIVNFLNSNIKLDTKSYNLLKRVKTEIYKLGGKKKSYKLKKEVLNTLKGLHIINLLFPLALNTIKETSS